MRAMSINLHAHACMQALFFYFRRPARGRALAATHQY
jgi:hypothetical protein